MRRIVAGAEAKLDLLEQLFRRHASDRTIVFTATNEVAYKISRQFLIPAITHLTNARERKTILERFESGDYKAVVTSKVLNEGVDVPEAVIAIILGGAVRRANIPSGSVAYCGNERTNRPSFTRSLRAGQSRLEPAASVVKARHMPAAQKEFLASDAMLTKDLLRYRIDDGQIRPAFLAADSPRYRQAVIKLFQIFRKHVGNTRDELEEEVEKYSASRTDYRVVRGLAKVLMNYAEFETRRTDATTLRGTVFLQVAKNWPITRCKGAPDEIDRQTILDGIADEVGLSAAQIEEELYADLPALALCRTWRMEAVIVKRGERLNYSLDDRSELVSHFRRFPLFDSKLESDFAADFEKTFQQHSHDWRLTRADAMIPVGRNEVMIPDFTLRNQKGREVYLEIVGFWTPEYLNRKIAKVREANLGNLILAVSKQLALSESVAEELNVIWFAKKLSVSDVLECADLLVDEK